MRPTGRSGAGVDDLADDEHVAGHRAIRSTGYRIVPVGHGAYRAGQPGHRRGEARAARRPPRPPARPGADAPRRRSSSLDVVHRLHEAAHQGAVGTGEQDTLNDPPRSIESTGDRAGLDGDRHQFRRGGHLHDPVARHQVRGRHRPGCPPRTGRSASPTAPAGAAGRSRPPSRIGRSGRRHWPPANGSPLPAAVRWCRSSGSARSRPPSAGRRRQAGRPAWPVPPPTGPAAWHCRRRPCSSRPRRRWRPRRRC